MLTAACKKCLFQRLFVSKRGLATTVPPLSQSINKDATSPGPGLFAVPAKGLHATLTQRVQARLGASSAYISSPNPKDQNWAAVIKHIYKSGGLQGLDSTDVDSIALSIPNSQRGNVLILPLIYEMMDAANIAPSKLFLNLTMAAYAFRGHTLVVRAFFDELKARGFTPDVYTYGHLIQAHAKLGDLGAVSHAFDEMKQNGLTPSLPVYTSILQTFIRTKEYDQADRFFELLKYMGTDTQPDVSTYNSMMMACSKRYEIERVLDLYREMTSRPIRPVEPNQETFNILIISCSKDPKYHLQAWKFMLEMKSRNFSIDRRAIHALMYLCANSGEVFIARAMIRQLALSPDTYPDAFTLWCLFSAYSKWEPNVLSPVMASEFGPRIQANFLFSSDVPREYMQLVPMLPHLTSTEYVFAEARAMYAFFSPVINEKTAMAYLSIFAKRGSVSEFRVEWGKVFGSNDPIAQDVSSSSSSYDLDLTSDSAADDTSPSVFSSSASSDTTPSVSPGNAVIPDQQPNKLFDRNWLAFELAIDVATKYIDEEFAQLIWSERGKWRKSSNFKSMPKSQRDKADFSFARRMVKFLAVSGQQDQALKIIESTLSQFRWKRSHVTELDEVIAKYEDKRSSRQLAHLLGTYHRLARDDFDLIHSSKQSR